MTKKYEILGYDNPPVESDSNRQIEIDARSLADRFQCNIHVKSNVSGNVYTIKPDRHNGRFSG